MEKNMETNEQILVEGDEKRRCDVESKWTALIDDVVIPAPRRIM